MHQVGREAFAAELRGNAGMLAEAVVQSMQAAHPRMFSRYGAEGHRRCTEDTRFHLEHLAAALDIDDPGEFLAYRRWLSVVLGARGIPEADIDSNFAAIASVLADMGKRQMSRCVFSFHPPPRAGSSATRRRESHGLRPARRLLSPGCPGGRHSLPHGCPGLRRALLPAGRRAAARSRPELRDGGGDRRCR
ncbi:MAG: phycocyanin beta chain [Actinomycetota bacterium]|nr:phycocyanin beta chain [Actinomycetota bacterium]